MFGISKAEAARQMGISRTTLYKLISQGHLSVHPDGTIDPTELVRAVSTLSSVHRERSPCVHREHTEHLGHDALDSVNTGDEHYAPVQSVHREHLVDTLSEQVNTLPGGQVNTLMLTIDILRRELESARERERDYRERIDWLQRQIEQTEQRYERLLSAPRTPARAPGIPQASPSAPRAPARAPARPQVSQSPRHASDPRESVLEYMRENPGGHTPDEVQAALALPETPRYVMYRLAQKGLLTHPATGVYEYADEARS